ncbi:hypothetical protein [Cupriavidus basilensis]|uniref:hypothetical protein n=1 Tax=Cupriavidus basilensis TaxID=68895 RepID=UPI0039F672BE
MNRLPREAPLPRQMQGRWVDAENPSSELVVIGGEITCYGAVVEYDYKDVAEEAGALSVSLGIDDESNFDSFQRANITGLVITPDGEFHAYNAKSGAHFVRPGA